MLSCALQFYMECIQLDYTVVYKFLANTLLHK